MAGKLNLSIAASFRTNFIGNCITLLMDAYYQSISNQLIFLDFDENDITAVLCNFIDKNPKRLSYSISVNTENHLFDYTKVVEKGFAAKFARIDMRFVSFWEAKEYKYYVEAKNLRTNDSSLKRRYIDTGINNFLPSGKYYECDGLLVGYVLEGTCDECKDGINKLLIKDNRNTEVIKNLNKAFYVSNHENKELNHVFLSYVT